MELDLTKCSVICCDTPDEKKAVLPVECSMILPDYYPDVMKILRYSAKAFVLPVVSDESGETVSGNISIEVNYVSEEGEFCLCGQTQPFSHNFLGEGSTLAAEAKAVAGDVSCRAVNKRRIDIHASLQLTLRTVTARQKDFVSSADGAGAVCKIDSKKTVMIVGEYGKAFTLEEERETEYGKPPVARIIRTEAFAQTEECHVIQDKVVLKGNVRVKMLWTPEREDTSTPEEYYTECFDFPVSRMIDSVGTMTDDTCDACFYVGFPEITIGEDGSTLKIKCHIEAFARVYRESTVRLVTDMFSEKYESNVQTASANIMLGTVPIELSENIREQVEFSDGAAEIIDYWAEPNPMPILSIEGKIAFKVKLCMFVKSADGEIAYFEKMVERETPSAVEPGTKVFYNLSATVLSIECDDSRSRAELSANIFIDGTIYVLAEVCAAESVDIDEEKPIKNNFAPVMLYFAEKGEHLWDIAKRYAADVEKIAKENGIQDETLPERTMLVIPK